MEEVKVKTEKAKASNFFGQISSRPDCSPEPWNHGEQVESSQNGPTFQVSEFLSFAQIYMAMGQ